MKLFKRIMLILFTIVILIVVTTIIFFRTAPQIGGKPSGDRLERMKGSPNFINGKFQNTVETKMEMTWEMIRKPLRHYLFEDKSLKNPRKTISVKTFDRDEFNSHPNDSLAFVWFGHSTILMKINGVTLLIDPVIVGKRASMFSFMGPERFDYSHHITIEELPKIDAVILSHDHYDHLDYPTIKALNDKVDRFYIPLGVGAHLEEWGVQPDQITELNWWDEIEFQGLNLALTPTRHFSGRGFGDRFKTLWGSWVIIGSNKRMYFSGDSGYFPGFKEIGEKYGPFDLTFMECGAYNEGWSEIHMFPEETAQAHLDVKGKLLMPIHWGKFDLALHPWKESVNRLAEKAKAESIPLFTPQVGQMVSLSDSSDLDSWWENVD
ncbi:MBL fold metallo-hydrolase [Ekhidna sp.]|jgi:L-ascorbate metabolism protein UlaG (beta-lactamase superfamily)|uniref:MBL fold metallo-hydrolase n=1 Tax=Ekhidna sp. TaxID=2608089 RepID=UPI0032ED412B